jgi:hypothetical protein
MAVATREELLAEFEALLLSIEDGNALIEAVAAVQERRPWDMEYRAVALRVAGKRSPALLAIVKDGWEEVEEKPKEAAKKISPPPQPKGEITAESKPADAQAERREPT